VLRKCVVIANGGGSFLANLPVLDGKNYDHGVIRMEAILGYQEILELVRGGVREKDEVATRKKVYKARCHLHHVWMWKILRRFSKPIQQRKLGRSCRKHTEVQKRPRKSSFNHLKGSMNCCP